jgi:hypothetical protein
MKIKTNDLEDLALDWVVTKCEGYDHEVTSSEWGMWGWATDWAQGGPLIEREGIALRAYDHNAQKWSAELSINTVQTQLSAFRTGPTPLIAAMRCYVASKLGDEVEIPKELT